MVVVGWIPGVHTPAQKLSLLNFKSSLYSILHLFQLLVSKDFLVCHFVIID